jgi:tetratricopeptide (TPR) repeat protein
MAVAGMLWAGISLFAFMQRRKRPWAAVGWAWYLVMLVPVLGIIQVGPQAHADRYTYLPQIGIYLGVTWLIAERRISRWWVAVLMISVAGVLTMCARNQAAYWKNSETLWTHTIACTTSNAIAHNNLGNALLQKGRVDEAITHFQEVLRIKPDDAKADFNLGNALLQKGNVDEAITRYQTALRIEPDFAGAHCSLGNAFRQQGKIDQSITQYREALRINPEYAQGHLGLGLALEQEGRFDAAAVHFQKTLQFDPANEDACVDLGDIFLQEGKVDAAISHYKSALQIKPDYALAHNNVANALLQKGNIDEAISYFQKALNIEPANARIHSNLGNAFLQKGNAANAIGQFRQALQLEPDNVAAQNNLAWLLATCPEAPLRNGNQAVELASRANQLAGGANAVILRTLAASYADAGRFSDAVETAQRALRLAGAQSKTGLAEQIQTELKLYQAGKPFHLPASTH